MTRAGFLWRIGQAARARGVPFAPERWGVEHEVWRCGRLRVAIPRRREIDEQTARRILAYLEPELRQGWPTPAGQGDLGATRAEFARPTYTAIAARGEDWWALEVLELPGVFTQARRLDLAERAIHDAIAAFLGALPQSFDVEIRPRLPPEIETRLAEARTLRLEVERMESAALEATSRLAQELLERNLTVRDAGRLLGLSYQRVAQVAVSRRASRRTTPRTHRKSRR